ncbi:peptidoglycan/xylan/chitin deacetylase (PgdA/CDA1 family) [Skermanella aerolata]|uniref:polysaccharide deacetylase family protein n=1 Tax=Skermanella aerolata TaxID=393310 RepID=UPI003D204C0C
MYHRVATPVHDPWRLSVSPAHFQEQLEALRRHYELVPLERLSAGLADRRSKATLVSITFDDGYRDNLTRAKPLLEHYECPATVFVATGYVGSRRGYWWDELAELILGHEGPLPAIELTMSRGGLIRTHAADMRPSTATEREILLRDVWSLLLPLEPAKRDEALHALADVFGREIVSEADALPMSADEIRRLASPLITIGGHTVTHPSLPDLPPPARRREVSDSLAACERIIGGKVGSFAYPFGDCDAESAKAAETAGCRLACSTVRAAVTRYTDRMHLPRLQVEDWTGGRLLAEMRSLEDGI